MVPTAVIIDIESIEERFENHQTDPLGRVLEQEEVSETEDEDLAELMLGLSVSDIPESPALFATRNCGIVTFEFGVPVWFSNIPKCLPNAEVGDPVPSRWNLVALNEAADALEVVGLADFDG